MTPYAFLIPLIAVPMLYIGSPRTRVARAYMRTVTTLTALTMFVWYLVR